MNLLKKPLKGVGNKMFGSAQSLASSSKNDLTQEFEVSEAAVAVPAAPSMPPPPIPVPSPPPPQQLEDSPPRQQQQQHQQRPLLEQQQPMQQFEMATEEANRMFSAPEPPPPPRPPSQQFHHPSQQQQPQQPQPPQPTPASTMKFEPGRPLEEELWFHGVLPRGEVVRLLEMDGDFLVRETVRNDEKQIVLSVMWTSPKHFIVQSRDGLYKNRSSRKK